MPRWPEREPLGDPSDPRGFEVLLARYLEHLAVRHYSPRSLSSMRRMLRQFGAWCAERGLVRPVEVSRAVVERYQRFLFHHRREDGRGLALGTQHGRLSCIKGFFSWLVRERYLDANPAGDLLLPKQDARLPVEGLSIEEVERILAVPDLSTLLGLRDRAILETFYSTGIRRSELIAVDLYDLDRDREWLTVRRGKGRKDRVVPIGSRALFWIGRYLEEVRPQLVLHPDEWALFVTHLGTRFNPEGLGDRVRRMMRVSGVRPRYGSCHLFRHTMATLMLESGADIRYLQEMLGHEKLDTTQIYTRVSIQKLKQVHEATHPGARLERREEVEQLLVSLAAEASAEELDDEATGDELAGDVEDGA